MRPGESQPCILPFGSFFVPGGCHFLSQSMAAFPFSMHSLRLSRTGNPSSALCWFSHSMSCAFGSVVFQSNLRRIHAERIRDPVKHKGQIHRVGILLATGGHIDALVDLDRFQFPVDVGNFRVFQEVSDRAENREPMVGQYSSRSPPR